MTPKNGEREISMAKVFKNPDQLLQRIKPTDARRRALLKDIDDWYKNADLNNPDYDDTLVFADFDEILKDEYGDEFDTYDIHDQYLTEHGIEDLNSIRWDMPAHKIKKLFKK